VDDRLVRAKGEGVQALRRFSGRQGRTGWDGNRERGNDSSS
jgi:hypothetical protein